MKKSTGKKASHLADRLLGQLEELADSLGIAIRYEKLKGEGQARGGGLCRLRGKYFLIIDSRARTSEKVDILAESLARFDLSNVYLKPGLREFLEQVEGPKIPLSKQD
ncbi:MAG: hypothetical protein JRJ29_20665 [Deltaproteobacteria bacterium]|nr:hypothetical protein [Deltaproteobacteria bacterium]